MSSSKIGGRCFGFFGEWWGVEDDKGLGGGGVEGNKYGHLVNI